MPMMQAHRFAVGLLACIAVSVPLAGPATAEDVATTLITEAIWVGDDGVRTGNTLTIAVGGFVQPSPYCAGDGCIDTRSARIEIQKVIKKRQRWVTYDTGTLASLAIFTNPAPALDTRRPTVHRLRTVLAADDTYPEVISPTVTIKVLPATTVRVLPGGLLTQDVDFPNWNLGVGTGTISITVRPAAAGRTLIVRSQGEVVAQTTTDARGRATLTVTTQAAAFYTVEVSPTRKQAGWSVFAPT